MVAASRRLGLRGAIAVAGVRATNWVSRRTGRGAGTVAGGRVGLFLDPHLLARLLVGRDVVLVSGTNGKTTTTAFVRAALGVASASNLTGANMPEGITAALADNDASLCVLEVDEPWLGVVMDAAAGANRRAVVLLNLSRDQLDRASEVRQLAQRWKTIFDDPARSGSWTVVANVNDPLVAFAVASSPALVACAVPSAWSGDAASCPVCTRPLVLDESTTVAAGGWGCTCGFSRPDPSVVLDADFTIDGVRAPLTVSLPGEFNRANAALAMVVAVRWGVSADDAARAIANVREVAGRFAVREWAGRTWRLMLAKNPAGFAALLPLVAGDDGDLVIDINDNVADGRDPAWLYDAPFELLDSRRVWCGGERALDLATRLEYAGVDVALAGDAEDFPAGVRASDPVDVVANYTAFAAWLSRSTPC